MNAIFEGILCGFLLSFLLGPVFIGLVKTSLHYGFKQGVVYALGVALSDVFYILLCYWGVVSLISNPVVEKFFYLTGGALLCVFGLIYFFQKNRVLVTDEVAVVYKKRNTIVKGFLMNAINPSVLFFWIGIVGFVDARVGQAPIQVLLFFTCAIGVVFSMDVLKAFLADKISVLIKEHWLGYLNKVLGLALFVVGAIFIWDIVKGV
jgi:L-lysine exporter family protein LysE/ArgO